jgi:predicted DNA-binding antitoxin AbrB/MazE fold protein
MVIIPATFEQGAFRPLSPVNLPEGSRVEISIVQTNARETHVEEVATPQTARIEDQLRAISAMVAADEWERLPSDLSDRLDDHVYSVDAR